MTSRWVYCPACNWKTKRRERAAPLRYGFCKHDGTRMLVADRHATEQYAKAKREIREQSELR